MKTKNFLFKKFKKTTMLLGCCLMASIAVAQTPFTNRQIKKTLPKTNHANPISVLQGNFKGTNTTLGAKSIIEPDWYKRITDTSNYPTVKFGGLHQDTQGNYIYVATNGNPGGTYKAVIVKTQNNGVELWRREFSSAYFTAGSKVVTDSQDNIFVLGEVIRDSVNRESYLIKYSSSGNVVWTKYYSQNDFILVKGMALLADSQDNIITISQVNGEFELSNQYYLINKFDQNGNILWTKKVFYPTCNTTHTKMGFYTYIKSTLFSDNSMAVFDNSFYFKLNSNGVMNWNNSFTSNVLISADELNDTIVALTGSDGGIMCVTKINETGGIVWKDTLPINYSGRPGGICINENSNVFVLAQDGSTGPEVIKLSTNGDLIYDNHYPTSNDEIKYGGSYFIKANEHDSIIIGGMGDEFTLTTVTIDSLGNLIAGNAFNTFESGYDYIYAYDGFNFYDGHMITGGNQRNLSEGGYDLFVTAIDFNANVQWTQFVKKEATSDLEVNGTALDQSNNTYLAGRSKYGTFKQNFNLTKLNDAGAVVWNNKYFSSLDGYATTVKVLSDNSVIAGGALSGPFEPELININPDGTIRWSLALDDTSFFSGEVKYINVDSEGNIIAASQVYKNGVHKIFIAKVAPDGTLIWKYLNTPPTNGTDVYHLTVDGENNIIFSGTDITSSGSIAYAEKINSNGQLLWQYSESYSGTDLISQAYGDNEGNTYLVGTTDSYGLIIKLDNLGQKVWSNLSTNSGYYYGILGKGNIIYAAGTTLNSLGATQSELVAFDTAGTILWCQNIAETSKNIYGQFIIGDGSNLYLSGYSTDILSNQYSLLAIYDYQGNLVSKSDIKISREGGDFNNFWLSDFAQNSTHLVIAILSSVVEPNDNVNEYNLAVIGNVIRYSKPYGASIKEDVATTFKCYPNPVTNTLYLTNDQKISNITIYNITGQAVISKSIHATEATLNVSGLASGIYTVKVESNENVESFKIIKK